MSNKPIYDDQSVQVLEGLEGVRMRPGMYIGDTNINGLHHLAWEIIDNGIDEISNGFGKNLLVTLHHDFSLSVFDDGRGIPTGINQKTRRSTIETIFTYLHAGAKFDEDTYKNAGGLHGVGAAVVNALSSFLICQVHKDNQIYEAQFVDGGKTKQSLKVVGETNQKGTNIHFMPDKKIFKNLNFNPQTIKNRLQQKAYLIKGLKITFINEINKEKIHFYYPNNVIDYVNDLSAKTKNLGETIYFNHEKNNIIVDLGFSFNQSSQYILNSFANAINTVDGGVHATSFKNTLVNILNEYAKNKKILKAADKGFSEDELLEGLIAVISVWVPESLIAFEGQTKNKLSTPEVISVVQEVLMNNFVFWLNSHADYALQILQNAQNIKEAKLAAKKARDIKKTQKSISKEIGMGGKLTPAQSKNPELNELFIVEGDSAGGSAKLGRNKKHQAILPLRGKVINVLKSNITNVIKNEEIASIFRALGTGIDKDFDIKKLKYHKVIIMTDADVDGSHIQVLLLTLFYKYLKPLIEKGHIYIAQPPLYKFVNKNNKEVHYAYDDKDLKALKQTCKNYEIQRYKGLGEMNADQLYNTTMNPNNRVMWQVGIEDYLAVHQQINILMGEDTEIRKQWIDENIDFSNDEDIITAEEN
ncbi:type IIA DNA topoisomerase subunit B [Ureaplasma miroungigenitalium]|uniref:DNA topoisomerase (ATP-hydrolyzing) n=1 Tax=Ureaplasma miroungigenitalium TaxID=1042321 RepID=A0ABT3BMR6_9BACT|nr:type IIA DNA topoisomerase subunit B [Ureaplasma miroungigenitalium]MCV3728520.1 type IIA DNA topoisomerase subunit B [Ureaplasma miroungigenitalium]MCV3734515.1 type IIA DNA topoisomerase subunit B [Ureaplasma miroungigenitalium]